MGKEFMNASPIRVWIEAGALYKVHIDLHIRSESLIENVPTFNKKKYYLEIANNIADRFYGVLENCIKHKESSIKNLQKIIEENIN